MIRRISKILSLIAVFSSCSLSQAQIQTVIEHDKKDLVIGDCIPVTVFIVVPPETCTDGMQQVHFYKKGISIEYLTDWEEMQKGKWKRSLTVCITGNKKNTAMLTIMKKTDKQSLFHQEVFEYEN